MKSKYFMIFAIAFLAQEITALPHSPSNALKNVLPSHKVPEEATVSDFGMHVTLVELVILSLEDSAGAAVCYSKEEAYYKKLIENYIHGMNKAAANIKQGPPKAQVRIEHAMKKFPIKLDKLLHKKNYDAFEEFMWDFSGDISLWDHQIQKDIKKLMLNNSNRTNLTAYVKELFTIRKKTESECKKIIQRITECMEKIETNF